ncbi:MAG: VCBS repeat-containing protein, partial [Pyrinomonadaceae bacterium]
LRRSTAGVIVYQFGTATDKILPGDYTGDGKADVAFWRPASGEWYILRSEDTSYFAVPFGSPGDVPVPGDYDGDGKLDRAVFRPATATWYVDRSTAGILIRGFGLPTDVPLPSVYVR